jgi:predicted choloylglycine hydrolase
MLHPRVEGAYYQIGADEGAVLYRRGFRVPVPSRERVSFGTGSEEEVRRIFPEVLDELRGSADGCQTSYEDVVALVLGYGALGAAHITCSVFATNNGSDIVFGRNYDSYYRFERHTRAYLTCPDGGYWSVGHSAIFTGREGGVNERGLAIAVAAVEETEVKPGMDLALAIRYVLDKCGRVEEAASALSGMRHTAANNFLLADREGNLVVVEAVPSRVRTRKPNDDDKFIVCTNHFLHPSMLEMENRGKRCWGSEVRYGAIYGALKSQQGEIDAEGAQAILSGHDGYVC